MTKNKVNYNNTVSKFSSHIFLKVLNSIGSRSSDYGAPYFLVIFRVGFETLSKGPFLDSDVF